MRLSTLLYEMNNFTQRSHHDVSQDEDADEEQQKQLFDEVNRHLVLDQIGVQNQSQN